MSAASGSGSGTPPLYDGPVVDAHHHVWDPRNNRYPWLRPEVSIPFRYGDYSSIKRPYLPDDYRRDAAEQNIRATVYMEAEWDPEDPIGETRFVTALAEEHGLPDAMVAQAWLHHPDVAAVLAAQARFPLVRSVRHKPGGASSPDAAAAGERTLMSDDRWQQGYALLEAHGLHFDLQTPWWNLHEAEHLARDFPRTRIILNHTGLPADRSEPALRAWHRAMSALAEHANVAVKMSGLGRPDHPWTPEDNRWIVRETVAMFGPQRAMFASNFPVDGLCATLPTIFNGFRAIVEDLPAEDQHQLFHRTAEAIYRLDPV
ncbi:amidohydrolase family protein [Roseomonas elaeocarpi]|uniref:Amidohydrolase family protein n=1 Tax=Roseomonas elaeocarpi TaxID=907779 RepID=A0ABV6JRH3_9PROT